MSVGDSVRGAVSRVPSAAGIGQDDIIFAMLAFAFVVWITTKGELPIYLAFFKPGTGAQGPAPVAVTASSTTGTSTPVTGAFPGTTNAAGSGIVGQLLNPSTDPIAGPVSTIFKGLTNVPGWFTGLGN